jgi:hypothetical protein
MVGHGCHHSRMDQTMLLAVTLGGDQNRLAVLVFDPSQLHTQVANEIRAVEDVTDLVFQKFIHGNTVSESPGHVH